MSARTKIIASDRARIREQGGRRALRAAIYNIEKLGIERSDFERIKACLESMISDVNEAIRNPIN